jgi:Glycosyltransferase family 87
VRRVWLVVAVVELGILLAIPAPANPDKPGRAGGIRTAAAQLRGSGPPIDLVQDYVGARDVARGRQAYPVLTRAYASVGLDWRAPHRSTHPPTAFLLALPVAWLPWKAAAAVWMVLMLAALAGAYWALGAPPGPAVALAPLTILWPPGGWSMGQLTPLWLLGLALAWRLRDRPAPAGAAIALASLTKLLPALSLLPFLLLRRWSVLRGFAIVWGVALVALLALDAGAIGRYLTIARSDSREQAARGENSALLWAAEHNYGAVGVAVAVVLVGAVVVRALRRIRRHGEIDRLSWDGVGWVGVALLPIAWIYSLLPLLPALARLVRRGGRVAAPLALVTFVIPFLVDPFGLPGGIRLAFATAALGVSLLAAHATSHAASGPSATSTNRGSTSAPASSSSSATPT